SALFSTFFGQSSRTKPASSPDGKSSSLMAVALPFAAIVFLLLLVIAVSVLMDQLMFDKGLIYSTLMTIDATLVRSNPTLDRWPDIQWLVLGVVAVAIVAFFAWRGVNINRFSAHSIYRNR